MVCSYGEQSSWKPRVPTVGEGVLWAVHGSLLRKFPSLWWRTGFLSKRTGVNILGLTLQQEIVVLQSLGSHYADQGSNISSVTYKLGDLGHTDLMSLNLCPNLQSESNNSSSWRIVVRIKWEGASEVLTEHLPHRKGTLVIHLCWAELCEQGLKKSYCVRGKHMGTPLS